MHPATIALMYDQVRAIYRALTGTDMPEPAERGEGAEDTATSAGAPDLHAGEDGSGEPPPIDEVARRFAELEAVARAIPAVVERVPPFSFAPLLDAYEEKRELVLQLAVPGVERGDVQVEHSGDVLVVSGVRKGERANGRSYVHAEIPRGPFRRAIRLPHPVSGEPRITLKDGLIEIHLARSSAASA